LPFLFGFEGEGQIRWPEGHVLSVSRLLSPFQHSPFWVEEKQVLLKEGQR
jgi:hypothetical protein